MTDNRNLLELTAAEKQDLERWAQSRTLPAGDVFRARLILALADGQSYREMVRGMRTSAATIARWRRRFEQDRLAGLEGRHRGSKPRTATPAVQARVVRRVQQQPSDGSTHWASRTAWFRVLPSRDTVAVCRLGCENRQGARQDRETAHQRGVYCLLAGVGEEGAVGEADPHRAGQSVRPQD